MDKKAEKMVMAFAIVGVLLIGSIVVLATLSTYDTQKETLPSGQTVHLGQVQMLNEEQAVAAAQNVAEGTFAELELKQKRNDPTYAYYEVEFDNGESETEVSVHAYSGAILGIKEAKSDELSAAELSQIKTKISEEQAKSIALAAVPTGRVISVEAEEEKGRAQYVVELDYRGRMSEVEIDMVSGAVVDIELEDEFEDEGDDGEEDEEEDDDEDGDDEDDEDDD